MSAPLQCPPVPSSGARPFEGAGILIASAAGFGLGLSGLPFYTTGVFVLPLTKAFGWSVSEVQGGLTLLLLTNVAALPVAAALVDRFGARVVALTSVILFALSFMSFSTIGSSLPIFYLHWIVLSITGAGTLAVTWTRAISAIFDRRRGLALGLAMTGTGLTALVAPILTNEFIFRFGWRLAYILIGAAPLVIAGPLVWFLFWDRTRHEPPCARLPHAFTSGLALDPRFWLLGGPFFFIGAGVAGVLPNMIKLLAARGFTPSQGAGAASLLGLFIILGRLGGGYLLDRMWPPAMAGVFFISAAGACLILNGVGSAPQTLLVAAAALGLAAGVELDMLPYLTARYFGLARLSGVLGVVSTFFYLGSALGPWGFAWMRDVTGSYKFPLSAAAGLFVIGAVGLLGLGAHVVSHQNPQTSGKP